MLRLIVESTCSRCYRGEHVSIQIYAHVLIVNRLCVHQAGYLFLHSILNIPAVFVQTLDQKKSIEVANSIVCATISNAGVSWDSMISSVLLFELLLNSIMFVTWKRNENKSL